MTAMNKTQTAQIAKLQLRMDALEAEGDIRRVVARYMEICDNLRPKSPMKELGELFCVQAIWEGAGKKYAQAFGGHKGRAAIVKFLQTYCAPPLFSSNVHFVTTESLKVNKNSGTSATSAKGNWVMLQTPSFANGESFVLAARLHLSFEKEDGCWRISRFKTTNLFGRPIEGGWHSKAPIPTPSTPSTPSKKRKSS